MKKTILKLSILLLIISCNSSDENTTDLLNGKWFMDSFSCFCGDNGDYREEYVLWNINTDNNIINVVNYFSDELLTLTTGEYNFTYTDNTISIQNGNTNLFYEYEFNDGKLILSNNPEADGPLITFSAKETDCIDNPLEDYEWLADIKFVLEANANAIGSQIIQYVYNDECVYQIDFCFDCADNLIEIYNTQGEVICQFGGIAGLNTCPNFFETATNKRVLYNDIEN